MKKICFFLLLVAISLPSFAQTKKIAWCSHAGHLDNFDIAMPDDFGLIAPYYYRDALKPINIKTINALPIPTKDSLNKVALLPDSILQLPKPKLYPQPKQKSSPKKDSVIMAYSPAKINQKTNFPNWQTSIAIAEKNAPIINSSHSSVSSESQSDYTIWGILLLLPNLLIAYNRWDKNEQ